MSPIPRGGGSNQRFVMVPAELIDGMWGITDLMQMGRDHNDNEHTCSMFECRSRTGWCYGVSELILCQDFDNFVTRPRPYQPAIRTTRQIVIIGDHLDMEALNGDCEETCSEWTFGERTHVEPGDIDGPCSWHQMLLLRDWLYAIADAAADDGSVYYKAYGQRSEPAEPGLLAAAWEAMWRRPALDSLPVGGEG